MRFPSTSFVMTTIFAMGLAFPGLWTVSSCAPQSALAAEIAINSAADWQSLQSGDVGLFRTDAALNSAYGQLTFPASASLTLKGAGSALITLTNSLKLLQANRAADGTTLTFDVTLENLKFQSDGTALNGSLLGTTTANSYLYSQAGSSPMSLNLTLDRVHFVGQKTLLSSSAVCGGVIFAKDLVMTARDAAFTDSRSTTGGAIYAQGAVTLHLENVLFAGNSSSNAGGVLRSQNGPVTITGSNLTFRENVGGSFAGALFGSNGGSLNLSGSNIRFEKNRANNNFGGAIYLHNEGSANTNAFFSGNSSSVVFTGNTDKNGKNDVTIAKGSLFVTDTGSWFFDGGVNVSSNLEISGGANVTFAAGSKNVIGGNSTLNASRVTFGLQSAQPTTFSEAVTGAGSVVTFHVDDESAASSYAVSGLNLSGLASSGFAVVLKDSVANASKIAWLTSKTSAAVTVAEAGSSPVWVSNNSGSVTGFASWTEAAAASPAGSTIILAEDVFFSNAKTDTGNLTIQSSTDAVRTIRSTATTIGDGNPRFVQASGLALTLVNVAFADVPHAWAGSVLRSDGGGLTLKGSNYSFRNCGGNSGGGAVYSKSGVSISGTEISFIGNRSVNASRTPQSGGAVWNQSRTLAVTGNEILFQGNQAGVSGGALYSMNVDEASDASSLVTLTGNRIRFLANTAQAGAGGAIYSQNSVTIAAANSEFTGNSAQTFGGAIYAETGIHFTGDDSRVTFSGNLANGTPNDLYVNHGNLTFSGTGTYVLNGGVCVNGDLTSSGSVLRFGVNSVNSIAGEAALTDSTLQLELTADSASLLSADSFSVAGTALQLFVTDDVTAGNYDLLRFASGNAPDFDSVSLFNLAGSRLSGSYSLSDANGVLTLNLIGIAPEPSAWALLLFGVMAMGFWRRRALGIRI